MNIGTSAMERQAHSGPVDSDSCRGLAGNVGQHMVLLYDIQYIQLLNNNNTCVMYVVNTKILCILYNILIWQGIVFNNSA